jgi:DNA topoisomerase-1
MSMAKKLLIVESPSKAKTISKYLGDEYKVMASVGHIRDLPKSNKDAIDIEHGFIPHYEIPAEKRRVVNEITSAAKSASEVLLATDPDREGEAISWHLAQAAHLQNPKRIVFHEITKKAVEEAIAHPHAIDDKLVRAQEARRVLDRLVGYDLSGLIWKKVRYGLSAGRVQSPALRILVEREREIRAFVPENFWVIRAAFDTENKNRIEFVCDETPKTEKEADRIVEVGKKGAWHIGGVAAQETSRKARAPFTTSTLEQAASSRLGYSPSVTMRLAQKLYEAGHITYMRTDSTILGKDAMAAIASLVVQKFGKEYSAPQVYKTKSKNAQEAHEAIRPTNVGREIAGASDGEKRLYQLIWRRAVSSQMSDAKLLKTKITAEENGGKIPTFSAAGTRTLFPGWLKVDTASQGDDIELPNVKKGERLDLADISHEGKQTEPPNRYSEAGLVKELEKRGIGRPSTYASIIQTLLAREYAVKIDKALKPTETGEIVSGFLEKNFGKIISDTFTARMEDDLDDIAQGKKDYAKTLKEFYLPFAEQVREKEKIPKVTDLGDAPVDIKCPECGGPMIYKLGKSGRFLSCKKFPECGGARTIEGEEIKKAVETGEICPKCGKGKLIERTGKFGTFVSCSRYPRCKYIKKDEAKEKEMREKASTGVVCPQCGKGMIMERRGKFGAFYSCSDYPACKFSMKARPTGKKCELCGSLMMAGTKTIPERCSNKNCPNHNPHKRV